jgi:hypothetical protein
MGGGTRDERERLRDRGVAPRDGGVGRDMYECVGRRGRDAAMDGSDKEYV